MTAERKAERTGEPGGERPGLDGFRVNAATRVGKDTGLLMLGDLFDRGLGFLFLVSATKAYGLEVYGAYLLALSAFQVVRTVVSFGLGRSLVRDAAAANAVEDVGRLKGAMALGFMLSLPLAIVFGSALVFGAGGVVSYWLPDKSKVVEPLRVFGMLTPLFSINFVLLQSLYGLGKIRDMVVANNVVEPATRLVALGALFLAGVSGAYAIPGAYACALVVSSLFAIFVFARDVWPSLRGVKATFRVKETLAFIIPITLNDLATRSFKAFNVTVVGVFRTATEVSILNVALKMTGVAFLFSGALMGAFRPRIAALLAQGRNDLLSAETRVYTRWILSFAILPYGLMIAFPADMLGLLGPQFVAAATTLRILCVGLLIGQSAGPLMALLVMSGRSKQSVYFLASAATLYTILALNLVPRYGSTGAAVSGLTTILLFAPVITTYVQRTLKIRLYGRRMLKPLFAAAVAFGTGALVALALPSVATEQAGHLERIARTVPIVLVVAAVYAGTLWKLGIEAEERAVLAPVFAPLAKIRRKLGKLIK